MNSNLLIALIVIILVTMAGAFFRRRPETPGRRRTLWLIGVFGVIAIAFLIWTLLSR